MSTDEPGSRTSTGVERALDVLRLFGDNGHADPGVTEIAERLRLSKAVVHRILTSFRVKGFVTLDEESRRYRLGPQVLALGLAYLDRLDVHELARRTCAIWRSAPVRTPPCRSGWDGVACTSTRPRPRELFLRLVDTADVVVEDFRPGTLDRWGRLRDPARATMASWCSA